MHDARKPVGQGLEATARTDTGTIVQIGRREYREIGLDLDGCQRTGSWQIRQIIDLSLQPVKTVTETFVTELPAETNYAEIEVKISMWPDPKTDLPVHRVTKRIEFAK